MSNQRTMESVLRRAEIDRLASRVKGLTRVNVHVQSPQNAQSPARGDTPWRAQTTRVNPFFLTKSKGRRTPERVRSGDFLGNEFPKV